MGRVKVIQTVIVQVQEREMRSHTRELCAILHKAIVCKIKCGVPCVHMRKKGACIVYCAGGRIGMVIKLENAANLA
jgi:hypothetical protein